MKKNMGTPDKMIRILISAVIAILFFAEIISGTLAIVLLIFAGILLVTSFVGFCPLYYPFSLSTKKE